MRYWALASTVTFSSFAIGLALLSAIAAGLAGPVARSVAMKSPSRRAAILLWLRMLPAAGALAFAVTLVLPTFLYYEPPHTDEPLRRTMAAVAAIGIAVLVRAAWRVVTTWLTTRRLALRWTRGGRQVPEIAQGLATFVIDDRFPTVAVVGCVRPSLFVSERVFDECTPDEIQAMILHERAHIRGRDNLKRLLVRACPGLPFAASLEAAWNLATEEAADASAAAADPDRRLDLANALIRLARIAPVSDLPAAVSAFYHGGSIETRVRLLLDPPPPAAPGQERVFTVLAGAGLVVAFVASAPAIHAAMEALVRFLP
jgi:Zn-dependent protease with chaperone function